MTLSSGALVRLRALFHRRRDEAELDEELQYHLEREIDRNVARGMPLEEARYAARRAFGNLTLAAEDGREAWRWPGLETLRQDLDYGVRALRRAPAFVAGVTATIGVGLGLLATVFTLFDAYVLRSTAVRDPGSLYEAAWTSRDGREHRFTQAQLESVGRAGVFMQALGFWNVQTRLRGSPSFGELVSGDFFDALGVPPAIGRMLSPADAVPGNGLTVVLSYNAWQRMFGGDSAVLGQRVSIGPVRATVVGVARRGFVGLESVPFDFWMPLSAATAFGVGDEASRTEAAKPPAAREDVRIIARLRPGASAASSASALGIWLRHQTADLPRGRQAERATLASRASPMPVSWELLAAFTPIAIAFGLVMLIACANVANMMLARGMSRQREIGIRLSLGASRPRLIQQLLTESLLLSIPAGVAALLISRLAIAVSTRLLFATVPTAFLGYLRLLPFDVDGRIAGFMVGSAVLAAVAFGLAPALQATRPDIVRASRGDFDTPFGPSRLRSSLVVVQVAVSCMLLVWTGVLLAGARQTSRADPGIRTENVVQLELLDHARERVIDTLRGQRVVALLASAERPPLDGLFPEIGLRPDREPAKIVRYNAVSPEYFGALSLRTVEGRLFSADEARSRAPVVVVSRSTAARLWPRGSAIGHTLTATSPSATFGPARPLSARVIGVVANAAPGFVGASTETPTVYYPRALSQSGGVLLARVLGDAETARVEIERTAAAVDSGAVVEAHTLAAARAVQIYPLIASYWVAMAIGAVALFLAVSGVYGVLACVVVQRSREFGIRLALGAAAAGLIGLVLRQSMRLAAIGAASGLVGAFIASRLLAASLFFVNTFDAYAYVGGVTVVLVACAVAGYVPSRRAGLVDPMEVLRVD